MGEREEKGEKREKNEKERERKRKRTKKRESVKLPIVSANISGKNRHRLFSNVSFKETEITHSTLFAKDRWCQSIGSGFSSFGFIFAD